MIDINSNNKKAGPSLDMFTLAEYSRENAEKITYSNYSYWRSTIRTFFRNKAGVAMLVVLLSFSLFAVIQPHLPNQQSITRSLYLGQVNMYRQPPSAKHWFGTDTTGRDIWARVWAGTRTSLSLAVIVAMAEVLIGVVMGTFWGYMKSLDRVFTEIYNVIANIPSLILYVLIAYILKPGFWTIIFVMVVTGWIYMARYIRNMVIIIRDREYNLASRSLGTPVRRMLFKNIVPFLVSVIIMRLAVAVPGVIAAEVTLAFLGLGLPATTPSLGAMVANAAPTFQSFPHLLIFPSLAVGVIATAFYVVGNAFSDASDPRNHM